MKTPFLRIYFAAGDVEKTRRSLAAAVAADAFSVYERPVYIYIYIYMLYMLLAAGCSCAA